MKINPVPVLEQVARVARIHQKTNASEFDPFFPEGRKRLELFSAAMNEHCLGEPTQEEIRKHWLNILALPINNAEGLEVLKRHYEFATARSEEYKNDSYRTYVPNLERLAEELLRYENQLILSRKKFIEGSLSQSDFSEKVREQMPQKPLLNIILYFGYKMLTECSLDGMRHIIPSIKMELDTLYGRSSLNQTIKNIKLFAEQRIKDFD